MRLVYELTFPEGLKHENVVAFARALSTRPRHGFWRVADPVTLEVVSSGGDITWWLGVEQKEEALVLGALRSAVPSSSSRLVEADQSSASVTQAWELRLNTSRRPLSTGSPEQVTSGLLGALSQVRRGEHVVVHWLIGPWVSRRVVPTPSKQQDHGLFELEHLVHTSEEARAWRDKQSEPVLAAACRIGIKAEAGRTRLLRQRAIGALQLARAPGVGFQRRQLPKRYAASRLHSLTQPAFGWPSLLNASELACVIGWPIGNPTIESVAYGGHRQLSPASGTTTTRPDAEHRVTGEPTSTGVRGFTHLPEAAGLVHMHALGPSGRGKSTLLANLALQDVAAGRPVVVIDPGAKGDLVRDIANRIPREHLNSVIVLDPSDDTPVGLNLLAGDEPELVVDGVVHVFRSIWSANWGPRTADVLHHGLLTLAKVGGMTLCELPPLLINDAFRREVLRKLGDDALGVGPFWASYNALGDNERATVIGPALNKLRAFTQRTAIRGMIGQNGGIDLGEVFTKKQTLLVNLSPSTLGSETAQLLGALLLSQLWQAITARGRLDPSQRHPAFAYIDEFQQTLRLPLDLADALVQARGLGVGLILAHQHLGQLSKEVRDGVLANAGSRVVFGLRPADASVMSKELGGGLTADDITNLPQYETYQSLHQGAGRTQPVSVRTLPLPKSRHTEVEVRRRSRVTYGTPRSEVDEQLIERRQVGPTPGGSVGRRPRHKSQTDGDAA